MQKFSINTLIAVKRSKPNKWMLICLKSKIDKTDNWTTKQLGWLEYDLEKYHLGLLKLDPKLQIDGRVSERWLVGLLASGSALFISDWDYSVFDQDRDALDDMLGSFSNSVKIDMKTQLTDEFRTHWQTVKDEQSRLVEDPEGEEEEPRPWWQLLEEGDFVWNDRKKEKLTVVIHPTNNKPYLKDKNGNHNPLVEVDFDEPWDRYWPYTGQDKVTESEDQRRVAPENLEKDLSPNIKLEGPEKNDSKKWVPKEGDVVWGKEDQFKGVIVNNEVKGLMFVGYNSFGHLIDFEVNLALDDGTLEPYNNQDQDLYDRELDHYLKNDINYQAGDNVPYLEQIAADSFFAGWHRAKEYLIDKKS